MMLHSKQITNSLLDSISPITSFIPPHIFLSKPRQQSAHRSLWWFACFCIFWSIPMLASATEPFPLYSCLKPNVKFWEDVYSRYSTRQGILHDMDNLGLVYTVIDLAEAESFGAAQINSERIKAAKDRIRNILFDLGAGKQPITQEQRYIASLLQGQPHSAYQRAADNIRLQIGQKDRFYQGVIRSGKFLAQFKQIFAAEGLPPELAYLPHVESSFNPKAFSKIGAAGLWQFTHATGKDYLTINERIDERYDPYLATRAAAQLLKKNYSQLQSWPLALTAYNYGRSGMLRAVSEKGSYENIFKSYDQGSFKFASRNFYSEFLAALRVASRLGGDSSVPYERPEPTVTFRLKEDIVAHRLQSSFHVSPSNLARLNPALTKSVLNGEKSIPRGYLVRLPATKQIASEREEPSTSIVRYTIQERNRYAQ